MSKSEFKKHLAGMKKNWKAAGKQAEEMFGNVAAGTYVAVLQSAGLKESTSSGKLFVRREFVILEGEAKGEIAKDNMQLETDFGLVFLHRWIDLMGFEAPEDPTEIEDLLAEMVAAKSKVKIRVTQSGDFTNVSVIELLEEGDGEGDDGDDDEIEYPTESELKDMDRDELKQVIEEYELEVNPKKFKKDSALIAAIIEAIEVKMEEAAGSEGDDADDDDDDDDDEKPELPTEEEVGEMSKKELEELIERLDLDVAAEKRLGKYRKAVWAAIEALGEEAEEEEPEEEEEEESDGLDDLERAALKKILKDEEIDFTVTKKVTDDEIREAIREARGDGEEEEEEADPNLEALKEFCSAQDIDFDDDDDIDALKEKVDEYKFPVEDLTADEIKLLETLELGHNIVRPEPEKKVKKGKKASKKK